MKLILVAVVVLFSFSFIHASIFNACEEARSTRAYKKLHLDRSSDEACYLSIVNLINEPKTKKAGIELMSKFMYSAEDDYRIGAVLELGNSASPYAVKFLVRKGISAIDSNNSEEVKSVTAALVSLNKDDSAVDLAKYAKRKGKTGMMTAIRNEYYVYAWGKNYTKMQKVAGKVVD